MKAVYNVVTFLAALVVLGWGGLQVYQNWDYVKTLHKLPAKCKSCTSCKCTCGCDTTGFCKCDNCPCQCGCNTNGKCNCK